MSMKTLAFKGVNCEIPRILEKGDTGRCTSEDVGSSKEVNCEISRWRRETLDSVRVRTLSPQKG